MACTQDTRVEVSDLSPEAVATVSILPGALCVMPQGIGDSLNMIKLRFVGTAQEAPVASHVQNSPL